MFIPNLDELLATARPLDDPFDSVDRLLLHVARSATRAGEEVHIDPTVDYPIAFARDPKECEYFIELARRVGLLDTTGHYFAQVSPDGWRRLKELRGQQVDQDSAFVAMSFSSDLKPVYNDGIEPALRATGYRAIRVDLIAHNGKIDDRVVADIRRSSLLVADFSQHRHNVYFEAGLALGLGRHVIWTCRVDDIDAAHFDTRQYNHVVWQTPAELRERLQQRIEATIPGRPLSSAVSYEAPSVKSPGER